MNQTEDVMRERRDAEIARSGHRPMPSPFETKVVGVSFVPTYPENLHHLKDFASGGARHGEMPVAILVRNPDNVYDSNAVEVHIPALGEHAWVGHLTRPIAQRLAPELDGGGSWGGKLVGVLINPEYPDRPGISITCARVGEEEA